MKIRPGCTQHIGSRQEQQDSFAFSHIEDAQLVKRAGILAVVADGMGGLALGRESGDAAVKAVLSVHESSISGKDPVMILRDAVEAANRDVLSMAVNAGVMGEAGSTLVAVIVKDDRLYWTSVGDSRIYLFRSGDLTQLNLEQNYATELMHRVAAGEITREEALNNPDSAGLTNFIGNPDLKPADASIRPLPLQNGDWLVLCSDGLFGTLDDDEIREELYGNPSDASDRLVKKVISRSKPHQDNVSVAILACGDKEPVTVKTQKRDIPDKIFQAVPVKKSKIPLILGVLAVVLVVAGALAFYLKLWKDNAVPSQVVTPSVKSIPPEQPLNPQKPVTVDNTKQQEKENKGNKSDKTDKTDKAGKDKKTDNTNEDKKLDKKKTTTTP